MNYALAKMQIEELTKATTARDLKIRKTNDKRILDEAVKRSKQATVADKLSKDDSVSEQIFKPAQELRGRIYPFIAAELAYHGGTFDGSYI